MVEIRVGQDIQTDFCMHYTKWTRSRNGGRCYEWPNNDPNIYTGRMKITVESLLRVPFKDVLEI